MLGAGIQPQTLKLKEVYVMLKLRNNRQRRAVVVISIIVGVIIFVGAFTYTMHIINEDIIKNKPANEEVKSGMGFENWKHEDEPDTEVYDVMHEMINTKIEAEDGLVWGEIEITPQQCDRVIKLINDGSYGDEERLLKMLNMWKKGDFSDAVAQHNYLWEILDGTVGKAKNLK